MRLFKQSARFARVVAVAGPVLALPVVVASPAGAAATGDWGWGAQTTTAPAGSTFGTPDTYPRLPCHSETCTYSESMIFDGATSNGTTITTPVGTTTDFVNGTTGEVIGTCTVVSTTIYRCQSTSSGSVTGVTSGTDESADNSLHGSGNLDFAIPIDQEQDSLAVHWSWSDGAPAGDPNDHHDVIVSGQVDVPLVDPVVAGGAGGVLALVGAGYVLHRRRRINAQLPTSA